MSKHKTTRQKLAKRLNNRLGKTLTLRESEVLVSDFIDDLIAVVVEDGEIKMNGWGRLTVHTRKAREGHNPKTGARIPIPAKTQLLYKASPQLLKTLNS